MEDKIILKFKTKNILNFYEIEPWCSRYKEFQDLWILEMEYDRKLWHFKNLPMLSCIMLLSYEDPYLFQ